MRKVIYYLIQINILFNIFLTSAFGMHQHLWDFHFDIDSIQDKDI